MKYVQNLKMEDEIDWVTQALDSKRQDKDKLELEKENLQKIYKNYDAIIVAFNLIPTKSNYRSIEEDSGRDKNKWSSKKMFMDYYNNPPKKLRELLTSRRKEHELTSCPYCGNPVTPTTLDHFMPKDLWAEYSMYPNNLVPQCVDCAPIKSDFYYCKTSKSCLFIHPLYNDVLSKIGISITTEIIGKEKFNFKVTCKYDPSIQKDELERIILHLNNLDISNRVKDYCRRKIKTITKEQKNKKNDIRDYIDAKLSRYSHPLNVYDNWEVAFYASLRDEKLIMYLNGLCPPNNLEEKQENLNELTF